MRAGGMAGAPISEAASFRGVGDDPDRIVYFIVTTVLPAGYERDDFKDR